jgi:hypothetical protein
MRSSCSTPLIDEASEHREETRNAVDFIQYHQLVKISSKIHLGFGEPGAVTLCFQVEIQCVLSLCDREGESRFPYLPRTEETDGRDLIN